VGVAGTLQARSRELDFFLGEPQGLCLVRRSGPDERADQADWNRDDGIDDEHPPPACETVNAGEVRCRG
jgi:hypothetical protein